MPQSLFVFASGAGARIRAVQPAAVLRNGYRPDRPARGRGCPGFAGSASLRGASRRLVPAISRASCLSCTGGVA